MASRTGEEDRAERLYRGLLDLYPGAHCELDHRNAYELLVATILSAQCTDARVNMVTPALFARYPDPSAMAAADPAELEGLIRSTGFYRNKTKALLSACRDITERHGGRVPASMDELVKLHGVARKTANVVLGNAFNLNEGVVVDTHVGRLAQRMALTAQKNPVKIERDLMALFDRSRWTLLAHLLIWHGRRVCTARRPACAACRLRPDCPRTGLGPEIKAP
jgi:endonuclease-3